MVYQVLARRSRPQDFAGVVGQAPIVTALRNALTEGRIAQAYLFSGIRGVGKTSVARVLAKAINCERGPAADPCNDCSPCREITAGADLDVIEVDAATYSKVEQVRELTESLKYGPARDRYKVVVLDEIHRLSRQAFDALLKIVEEPPARLLFIFATTQIEDVPATILSRCQEFHFRRVPAVELAAHLRRLAAAESIRASDTALRLIARAGEGSVRDAVALLDQLATFGSGVIADAEAGRLLGGVDAALFHRLLTAILAGDAAAVAAGLAEVDAEGFDARHVFTEFVAYCRDALHLALGGAAAQVDLPAEEADALAALVRAAGYENLLRLLHQLLGSEPTVRRSELGGLALEIALLKAAELPKLLRIEELLAAAPAGASPAAAVASSPPRPPPAALAAQPPPAAAGAASAPPPPASHETPTGPAPAAGTDLADFLAAVSARRASLAAHLAAAGELRFADGELTIAAPEADPWLRDALARESNRQALETALLRVWGPAARWRLVSGPPTQPIAPAGAAAVGSAAAVPAARHPTVQTLLDLFGGRVEAVEATPEPAAGSPEEGEA